MKFWLAGLLIATVVVIDFFASFYFFMGKKPEELVGLSKPKVTITPFPTLIIEQKTSNSRFSSLTPKALGDLPQIKQAEVVFANDNSFLVKIDYGDKVAVKNSSLLMIGIVCDEQFCESSSFDVANGWPKEWKISNKQGIKNTSHNKITLVVKVKGANQGIKAFSKN